MSGASPGGVYAPAPRQGAAAAAAPEPVNFSTR